MPLQSKVASHKQRESEVDSIFQKNVQSILEKLIEIQYRLACLKQVHAKVFESNTQQTSG